MTARAWLLFAAVSVVWGVPYFFIKVAVEAGVPPAFVAWSRVALGAAVLLPLAWRRGALRGLAGRWPAVVAYTACEVAVPFLLIAAGEQHIASSLAAILIASMPLMVALLSVRLSPDDRPTGLRLVGLVVGFGGVVALLGIDVAGRPGELLGAVLVLVATLGYATAPIIVNRRLADLDPLGPIAASLAMATLLLVPAVLVGPPDQVPPGDALGALAVLGVACTALGLVLFFQLIVEAGPSRASVITYVNPLVAVVLGVLVLDERVGAMSVVGLLAILGGSWLSTRGRADEPPRPSPAQGVDQDPPLPLDLGLAGLGGPLGAANALVPDPLGVGPQLGDAVVGQLLQDVDVHCAHLPSGVCGLVSRPPRPGRPAARLGAGAADACGDVPGNA
jgi:drug/metabolite transporter (DMT)-like permease